jgi:carbon-monoxide dehydrogenase medium subunit
LPPSELIFSTPTSVEDAIAELAGEDALAVGGGTSIALMLKNRLIEPERLVYLGKVPGLSGISETDSGEIRLGATTTLRELNRSALVQSKLPSLAQAAGQVGNPRVRAVATLGGAVVHGDPRQDLPPVLLSLGARARIVGAEGAREVPFSEFFFGFMETATGEDELVTEVTVPVEDGARSRYTRFTPGSEDDYPTVGVAVSIVVSAGGIVELARIALGGVDGMAILATDATDLLIGARPDADLIAAVAAAAASAANPSDDQRGSESYKRAMVEVWTRRTLNACLA